MFIGNNIIHIILHNTEEVNEAWRLVEVKR